MGRGKKRGHKSALVIVMWCKVSVPLYVVSEKRTRAPSPGPGKGKSGMPGVEVSRIHQEGSSSHDVGEVAEGRSPGLEGGEKLEE